MNKREFLLYLEKRLSILKEKERQDIISEYSQHIDMKIKSGLTESEAIKDFGDPKEFVDEILEAYNVDPEYEEELVHNDNAINKVTDGIRRVSDFVFSQSPGVLIRMLAKIFIVFAILSAIVAFGFVVLGTVFMGWLDLDIIGGVILFAYLVITVPVAFYILYIYTKKLAASVGSKCGSGLLSDIGRGVNAFADFIITQKPSALLVLAFKLFVMSVMLFIVGMIGLVIPAIIGGILDNFFSDMSEIAFMLYMIIAVPVCLYILWCYGARLVSAMHERVKGKSINKNENMNSSKKMQSETESTLQVESENMNNGKKVQSEVESTLHRDKANENSVHGDENAFHESRLHGDVLLTSLCKTFKGIAHFGWKAVVLIFKASVIMTLCVGIAMLVPVVILTGAAFVAMVMGYPAIGLFLVGIGGIISAIAFILFVVRVVFLGRISYEKSV